MVKYLLFTEKILKRLQKTGHLFPVNRGQSGLLFARKIESTE